MIHIILRCYSQVFEGRVASKMTMLVYPLNDSCSLGTGILVRIL